MPTLSRRFWTGLRVCLLLCGVGLLSCAPASPTGTADNDNANDQFQLDDKGVGFPTGGDALIIVEESEPDALGSAVYYGLDDGTTVFPTQVLADGGESLLRLILNASGDPIELNYAGITITTTYNDDGTINVRLLDEMSNGFQIFDIDVGVTTAKSKQFASQLINLDDLFSCGPSHLLQATRTVQGGAPDGELFDCILEQESLQFVARMLCLIQGAMFERLKNIQDGCPAQPDPQACVRRVSPWIEAQEQQIDNINVFLAERIKHLDMLETCPPDSEVFRPDHQLPDYDGDGVRLNADLCPRTPAGEAANSLGCSISQLGAIDCRDLEDSHCCSGDLVCDEDCPNDDSDCDACQSDGTCVEDCAVEDPDCVEGSENGNDNTSDAGNDNSSEDGNANDNSATETCEVTGCPDGQACIDGACGPCAVDEDCPDGQICILDECLEGVDVGEGCEVTGCGEREVCCNSECQPVGEPTAGVCPASFEMDFGVFEPAIRTVVLDRLDLDTSVDYSAVCVYVREDGASGGASLVLYYEPIGVGSSPSGMCGASDDDGDNIVAESGYHSTIRTLSATSVTSGIVRVVDPALVLSELIANAVSAGVGSDCCLGE